MNYKFTLKTVVYMTASFCSFFLTFGEGEGVSVG